MTFHNSCAMVMFLYGVGAFISIFYVTKYFFFYKFMLCNILRKFSFLRNYMSLFLLYFLCLARMF